MSEIAAVLLVDAGLAAIGLGLISIVRPLRFLHIKTRRKAVPVLVAGSLLLAIGFALPAGAIHLAGPTMQLDAIVPTYQFGEAHEIRVHASLDRTYQAALTVRADEIRFFRLLTWLRSPYWPGHGPESILNAGDRLPLLTVALRSGFVQVYEDPGHEVAFGTVVCCGHVRRQLTPESFVALDSPGVAKAIMNFHLEDEGNGWVHLRTQTRVYATDDYARRRFAVYWRTIYPGSTFIRRMWLEAIKQRAEGFG